MDPILGSCSYYDHIKHRETTCKVPAPQIFMTNKWVNDMDLDVFDCAKRMMIFEKQFH